MSKISVVVPVYKVEKYLERCVSSILEQTYKNFELLLTDDGGDDNSGSICDETSFICEKAFVIHQKNAGLSAARNSGIEISRGALITFIDSDDWVNKRYLEILNDGHKLNNGISMVGAKYASNENDETTIKIEEIRWQKIKVDEYYEINNPFPNYAPINAWGKLFGIELFSKIRFPLGKIHEDRFTTHKLIFQQDKVCYCNEPLYYYYDNPQGLTRAKWSPRHLDDIEAFEEQLTFLKDKNIIKPYLTIASDYLDGLFVNMWEIKQLNGEYLKEYDFLKKKLKKALKKFRNILKLGKNTKYDYYAYPFKMKVYDYYKALKRRVLR